MATQILDAIAAQSKFVFQRTAFLQEASMSGQREAFIYAHTLLHQPPGRWETLSDHAAGVATLAEDFAAGEWGRLLGLWHDLGKMQLEFQDYLHGRTANGPPHAWVGALFALTQNPQPSFGFLVDRLPEISRPTLVEVSRRTTIGKICQNLKGELRP
jgi:hypothetical protein